MAYHHSSGSSNTGARHGHAHVPATPSQLRQAHVPSDRSSSPEDTMHPQPYYNDEHQSGHDHAAPYDIDIPNPSTHAAVDGNSSQLARETPAPRGGIIEVDLEPTARTRLLNRHNLESMPGSNMRPGVDRNYGSFAGSVHSDSSLDRGFPGITERAHEDAPDATHALLGDAFADGVLNKTGPQNKSMTWWLAERHGIRDKRMMYLRYYIPILNWTRQYKWKYVKGDLVAAITMASFYIPMSLSYASNLAHLPPVHGLYSFAFNPLIYAILGTCPQMVVGPEAPGSLLVGEIVRENIRKGTSGEHDEQRNAEIAGIVTCLAGAFILLAGSFRLGFLDNVLSRPFLRGFISAIGVVIFVDQLIPQMGLARLAAEKVAHGSCMDKAVFLFRNVGHAHGLTCAVSFTAFAIIMFFRYRFIPRSCINMADKLQRVQKTATASLSLCRLHSRSICGSRSFCNPHVCVSTGSARACSSRRRQLGWKDFLSPLPL